MRWSTPTVRHGLLALPEAPQEALISVGTAAWYAWLETATLFSFASPDGSFTARKEQRQRGGWYWKAYRTYHGKLSRIYLGKTADLTRERLEQAAQALIERGTLTEAKARWQQTSNDLTRKVSRTQPGVQEQLLLANVLVPPLRPDLVLRTRLIEALSAYRNSQLILLSAPAGFGKTTLLGQWSVQTPWLVTWVSLEASENNPLRFWHYLIGALEKVAPGFGQEALELAQGRPSPPIESVVICLLNAFLLFAKDVVLILDDYHLITTQSIHHSLTFFLEHLPPKLHVILASRADPPLPLARLRMRQQLFELRASDLRFTPEEVAMFFAANKSLHLSEEQVTILATSTEGWIAALHLAALSLQGCEDIPGFLRTFGAGTHHLLADYLAEEVLQQQPKALQSFLVQTAFLDRLSGPLCEAVIGDHEEEGAALQHCADSVQALLEHLEQTNLLLIPLDAERCWYRYHHLFAEFLRERLRNTAPHQLPVLHRRAATWYERQGLLAEAVHHILAAGDFSQAAQLICQVGETLVNRSDVTLLRLWLDALPEPLMHSYPQLCLLQAWTLATSGQFEPVAPWLQQAERCLDEPAQGATGATAAQRALPSALSEADVRPVQSMLGEITALRAHCAAFWGDIPTTMRFARQALDQLPQERPFLRGLSALNLGIACWLGGDILSASQALSEARRLGQQISNSHIILLATCGLSQVQVVQGKRHLAFKTGQEALRLASEEGCKALPAATYAYVGMGQMLYEWNDLDTASYYLEEGIALSELWGNGDMMVYGYTALAQVKQAQGDREGALEMIERARRSMQCYQQHSWIVVIMVAQQVRLALMQGDFEAIRRWTEQAEQDYVVTFEEMTRARIHLAQGQVKQARSLLEHQAQLAASSGRTGTLLEIHLLEGLVALQQHETSRAIQALEEALVLAEPEGYIRLFLDEGVPMRALLTMWLRQQQQRQGASANQRLIAYVRKVLGAFGVTLPANAPLSKRERDIMRQLAAGKSNEEIAATLVLEVSTVKWHLTRIYSKLHVQNRVQAMLQAEALQLL